MNNNECKHQWIKTEHGYYQCSQCAAIVPNKSIIGVPGVIFEDVDLKDIDFEYEEDNKKDKNQSK